MKENQTPKTKIGAEGNQKQKSKSKMPFVECSCGEKILVVPDVAAMSMAVKNHLKAHKDANEDHLIAQILEAAADQVEIDSEIDYRLPPHSS